MKKSFALGNSNHGVITYAMFEDWKKQRNIAKIGNPEPTIEHNKFCDPVRFFFGWKVQQNHKVFLSGQQYSNVSQNFYHV